MNKTLRGTLTVLCVALAVVLLGTVSVAQDVYQVNYYANANTLYAPDATVYIDNPGAAAYTNLCAMIYVFTYDEQMAECCGCGETPNNLDTLSVDYDLTANPLTSVVPTTGVIKIVSAAINNFPCDPTANVTPTPDLRAWATHIQYDAITETQFLDATLSAQELAALQSQCAFIGILGSGHGVCQCGTGAVKPAAKKKGAKK
ncbi:MAG TPA: hypothetical protein VKG65_03600 [Terriglobales bacterium]|nr:hypothetical protein [Terriglobales bacterium]